MALGYRGMKVRIYRKDKFVVLPEKWWIREKKLKNPSFDPRWQVIDYDKYIKNIHKFHDACGPIDNHSYVTNKRRSWEKKSDPKYIKAIADKKEKERIRREKENEIKIAKKEKAKLSKEKQFVRDFRKEQQKIIDNLNNTKFKPIEYPLNHPQFLKDTEKTNIPYGQCQEFYETDEWKKVRDDFLSKQPKPFQCHQCGRTPDPNYEKAPMKRDRPEHEKQRLRREFNQNRILVDHKLPIKYYWNLRLDQDNFQLLCGCCNEEKGNTVRYEYVKEATIRAKEKLKLTSIKNSFILYKKS